MQIEDLHIGMTVVELLPSPQGVRETIPMQVTAIFQDGTVYLDFEGNEGDVWEANIKDLKLVERYEQNEANVASNRSDVCGSTKIRSTLCES